jgi:anti-sigma28 factor (negative regulator of flagellin synthesis)
MKVTSVGQSNPIVPGTSPHAAAEEPKRQTNDRVQITNLSAYLAAAQSDSPARLERLHQLTAAVAHGGYHVDASAVSARIVEEHLSAHAA